MRRREGTLNSEHTIVYIVCVESVVTTDRSPRHLTRLPYQLLHSRHPALHYTNNRKLTGCCSVQLKLSLLQKGKEEFAVHFSSLYEKNMCIIVLILRPHVPTVVRFRPISSQLRAFVNSVYWNQNCHCREVKNSMDNTYIETYIIRIRNHCLVKCLQII